MGTNAANRYAPARRRRLLSNITSQPPILGDGWSYAGGRSFQYATSTEVNPALQFSGVVAGATYRVIVQVTEWTGTGQLLVRIGQNANNLAITAVGTYDIIVKAGVDNDLAQFIVDSNATMTSITIKNLYIQRTDVPPSIAGVADGDLLAGKAGSKRGYISGNIGSLDPDQGQTSTIRELYYTTMSGGRIVLTAKLNGTNDPSPDDTFVVMTIDTDVYAEADAVYDGVNGTWTWVAVNPLVDGQLYEVLFV